MDNKPTITKSKFLAYEEVRLGGKTNMWITANVSKLSAETKHDWISSDEALEIISNYDELKKKYLSDKGE